MKLLGLFSLVLVAAACGSSSDDLVLGNASPPAMPAPDTRGADGAAPAPTDTTAPAPPDASADGATSGGDSSADAGADATPPADAGPQMITFHVDRVKLAGSGCNGTGATVTAVPGGFRIDYADMTLDLRGKSALAGRRECSVHVPIDVPKGYYVASLEQKVSYAVARSAGSNGAIATSATFFDSRADPYTIRHDSPASESLPSTTARRTDRFAVGSSEQVMMCRGARPTAGFLAVYVAMSGQINNDSDTLRIALEPYELIEGVDLTLAPCP